MYRSQLPPVWQLMSTINYSNGVKDGGGGSINQTSTAAHPLLACRVVASVGR